MNLKTSKLTYAGLTLCIATSAQSLSASEELPDRGSILNVVAETADECIREGSRIGQKPDLEGIRYADGDPTNQFLNIFKPDASAHEGPFPVFLFAHQNGATACNVDGPMKEAILGAGFALVSWESIVGVGSVPQVAAAREDASLVLEFLRANSADTQLNDLDFTNIVIGGRSRGSGVSWELAHSDDLAIKGIYMGQALPDGFWPDEDDNSDEREDPLDRVSENSKPIYMAYRTGAGVGGDSHDPANGDRVKAKYDNLGFASNYSTVVRNKDELYADFGTFTNAINITGPGFFDDFSGRDLSGSYQNSQGLWSINDFDVAKVTATEEATILINGNESWSDYTVSAKIRTRQQRDDNSNWQVSRVVARVADNNNFYEAYIKADGKLILRAIAEGFDTPVVLARVMTDASPFDWNTLKMKLEGNQIELILNGQSQGVFADPYDLHVAGKAGVRTLFCNARLDDLSIDLL